MTTEEQIKALEAERDVIYKTVQDMRVSSSECTAAMNKMRLIARAIKKLKEEDVD